MKLYVARDKDESLYLYEYKPKKYKAAWSNYLGFIEELDSNLFPEENRLSLYRPAIRHRWYICS